MSNLFPFRVLDTSHGFYVHLLDLIACLEIDVLPKNKYFRATYRQLIVSLKSFDPESPTGTFDLGQYGAIHVCRDAAGLYFSHDDLCQVIQKERDIVIQQLKTKRAIRLTKRIYTAILGRLQMISEDANMPFEWN
jgi:hypothetical protein